MVALKSEGSILLVSRNGLDHTKRFPELVKALTALKPATFTLDGEVAVYDQAFISRFEWLRARPKDEPSTLPVYMVFDVLELGEAVTTSAHLLAGLLRCQCGGSMIVIPRVNKDGSVRRYYVCARGYKFGSVQCPARHYVPYDAITNAIVGHFTRLEEGAPDEILSREWDAWWTEQTARQGAVQALEERRETLDQELEQLGEAVARGGELPTLLTAIRRKERERAEVAAKLEHAQGTGTLDTAGWYARIVQLSVIAMQGLRASLEARGREGREMLKIVLQEPVVIAEEYEAGRFAGWTYRGAAQLGELLGRVPASGVTHGQYGWRTW